MTDAPDWLVQVLGEHESEWGDGLRTLYCICDEWQIDGYAEPTAGLRLRTLGRPGETEVPAVAFHRSHVAAVMWAEIEERIRENCNTCIPPLREWVDVGIIPAVIKSLRGTP